MPSLRKRVSSYFRQLSFINEPKERKNTFDNNSMVNKYLQGHIRLKEGPQILYGKNPTDLPNFDLGNYSKGSDSLVGCYSGPNGGLTTVKRTEKHLSVPDDDIDYIDTQEETNPSKDLQKSPILRNGNAIDNTTMVIKVAGQEYCVMNRLKHKKSRSLGSLSDFGIEIEKTKICTEINESFISNSSGKSSKNLTKSFENDLSNKNNNVEDEQKSVEKFLNDNNFKNGEHINSPVTVEKVVKNGVDDNGNNNNKSLKNKKENDQKHRQTSEKNTPKPSGHRQGHNLSKSKSEGNPYRHKKQGKIIKITHRPTTGQAENDTDNSPNPTVTIDDSRLPNEWNKKSDYVYGLSDSLYDRNQVTKTKNGDPIADCFGIIARQDSAILAVADGVNWGEKASIAAKSAVHGCLHYLNKTIFNDTKPFINLSIKDDEVIDGDVDKNKTAETNHISNTREVFICLLRAFNCAHDLILENQGMLTTLTVAVVVPLKQKNVKKEVRETPKVDGGSCRRAVTTKVSNLSDKDDVENYVCCVCNVGDTLAYVYSQKYGVRELTKGSHDINCNRDMRDALGALGPVDGINPELSNLTLSITTLQKGDLIFVASDGLTDNFDPIVCRFAVNSKTPDVSKTKKPSEVDNHVARKEEIQRSHSKSPQRVHHKKPEVTTEDREETAPVVKTKAPQKPPRKNKGGTQDRMSASRQSISSDRSVASSVSESQKSSDESQRTNDKVREPSDVAKPTGFEYENPLIAQFMRENSLEERKTTTTTPIAQIKTDMPKREHNSSQLNTQKKSSTLYASPIKSGPLTLQKSHTTKDVKVTVSGNNNTLGSSHRSKHFSTPKPSPNVQETVPQRYRFLRSKTTIDMRPSIKPVLRNEEGLPYVSPLQRYELTLLMMEDILRRGISGQDSGCVTARKLCENLINFTMSITAGKRHTLEDAELYFNNVNGVLVEVSQMEKKSRRRKALDRVQNLPGKLDHVSIVAYNVGIVGN